MPASRQKVNTLTSFWNIRALVSSLPTAPKQLTSQGSVILVHSPNPQLTLINIFVSAQKYAQKMVAKLDRASTAMNSLCTTTILHQTCTQYQVKVTDILVKDTDGQGLQFVKGANAYLSRS